MMPRCKRNESQNAMQMSHGMRSLFPQSVLAASLATVLGDHPPPYGHAPPPHHPPHGGGHYGYCDETVAPSCAFNGTTFCLEDSEYPTYEIKGAIGNDFLFAKKYADVADQSADDLVEHITREQEEHFDYSFYSGASTGHSPYDVTHWAGKQ